MPEKNSNKTSLIIASVTVFLIIGGIFLLNQSISRPRDQADNASVNDEQTTLSEDTQDLEEEPSDMEENTEIEENEDTTLGQVDEDESQATNEPETNNLPTTEPTVPEETESEQEETENSEVSVESGQILATATEVEEDSGTFKIIECGITNPVYCKQGTTIKISGSMRGVVEGERYKILGDIEDSEEGISISGAVVQSI
jgi:cytoskeletal protein RodZ